MELGVSALFAIGIIMTFAGIARLRQDPALVTKILEQYDSKPHTVEELELAQPFSDRIIRPFLVSLARLLGRLTPQSNAEYMRHKLELAGDPFDWSVAEFIGARVLAGIISALAVGLLFSVARASLLIVLLTSFAALVLGYYGPLLFVNFRIRARKDQVQRALPDALDLLTISVEAGLGFDAALEKVAVRWNNELGRLFGRMLAEVRMGKARQESLRDMANRIEIADVTNFVAALIQAEQLGVPFAKVLRVQSNQMRIQRRQRAQEQANQAPVKMLFPLAFLIFPTIIIVILGPTLIVFMTQGLGPAR